MITREKYFKDMYRPQIHYTAESHIINDPNGLFYYEEEYHLMHQYNVNNHIHWGHAVSKDLVHWKHLPEALAPDSIGQIWSGSAVVDWDNTSGLQYGREKVIVALFTYNEHVDAQQSQGLAYSNDRGRTWTKYERNPVLTSRGNPNFRDPKVFWFDEAKCWIMVLACKDHVEFYRSLNLIDWKFTGEFGSTEGSHKGVWECPDLFKLPVENCREESRWVLLVSVNDGAPAGGTGMQYFVGQFDGKSFVNDDPSGKVKWLDYGKDFYAGVTWNDIPAQDNRRLMIAWADNWLYRDKEPTSLFKGQFSTVRELKLVKDESKICIIQEPVKEMQRLRTDRSMISDRELLPNDGLELEVHSEAFELCCELKLEDDKGQVQIVFYSDDESWVKLIYDEDEKHLNFVRQSQSGYKIPEFDGIFRAPLKLKDHLLKLHIIADVSQVEIFADDGKVVMTNLFFNGCCKRIFVGMQDSKAKLIRSSYYELDSIWPQKKEQFQQFNQVITGKWAETIDGLEGDCSEEGMLICEKKYRDFNFQAKMRIMPYHTGKCAGLVFGMDGQGNGYRLLFDADHNEVKLLRENTVFAQTSLTVNLKRTYQICIKVNKCDLKIYCDGAVLIHRELTNYMGGSLGLCVRNTNAVFHDLQAD